jgi:hypothetical protein
MKQNKNDTIFRSKPTEGSFQLTGQVIGIGESGTVVDRFLDRFGSDRPTRPPTKRCSTTVGGDSQEPGTERPIEVETTDPAEGPQECFLDQILGVLTVPHHPQAEPEDHTMKAVEQQAGGSRVTGPERFHQRAVVHLDGPSPIDQDVDEQSFVLGYLPLEDHVSGFVRET